VLGQHQSSLVLLFQGTFLVSKGFLGQSLLRAALTWYKKSVFFWELRLHLKNLTTLVYKVSESSCQSQRVINAIFVNFENHSQISGFGISVPVASCQLPAGINFSHLVRV
jgi:hypothetical protein